MIRLPRNCQFTTHCTIVILIILTYIEGVFDFLPDGNISYRITYDGLHRSYIKFSIRINRRIIVSKIPKHCSFGIFAVKLLHQWLFALLFPHISFNEHSNYKQLRKNRLLIIWLQKIFLKNFKKAVTKCYVAGLALIGSYKNF